jgi:hypothetical protein
VARVRDALADEAQTRFSDGGEREAAARLFGDLVSKVSRVVSGATRALGGVESEYEGELNAAGQREGRGKARFLDGRRFEGSFFADQPCGFGLMTYDRGDVYDGFWAAASAPQQGKKEGEGT